MWADEIGVGSGRTGIVFDSFAKFGRCELLIAFDLVEHACSGPFGFHDVQSVLRLARPSVELDTVVVAQQAHHLGDHPFKYCWFEDRERQLTRVQGRRKRDRNSGSGSQDLRQRSALRIRRRRVEFCCVRHQILTIRFFPAPTTLRST
ncbi:hypothetical protein DMB37_34125 [Nocardia sp. CS682]|nr:hypothetical protein DMB37_34125 [Nocardia sp. CS682]